MKRKRKRSGDIIKACLSKAKHDTEDDAKATAIWQAEQEGCCSTFWFYKCAFCEGYHTYQES